jgi:hypothetical protein
MPPLSAPLLVLARGLFSLFSLGAPATYERYADVIEKYKSARCDDGSPVFDENDNVRLECTINGCGPVDAVCYYDDYFERCLDAYGRPTGRCMTDTTTCDGVISCAYLWIDCEGEWGCDNSKLIGCGEGHCKEEDT